MKRNQKPCSRIIHASKYERTHSKNREWWQNVFDTLEAEAFAVSTLNTIQTETIVYIIFKPSYKKVEVLSKILPASLLIKVLSMISVEQDNNITPECVNKNLSNISIYSRLHKLKMDSEETCCITESLKSGFQISEEKKRFDNGFVIIKVGY